MLLGVWAVLSEHGPTASSPTPGGGQQILTSASRDRLVQVIPLVVIRQYGAPRPWRLMVCDLPSEMGVHKEAQGGTRRRRDTVGEIVR